MKLVIVESPAKSKTINKYLGKDYKVIASYGHIRKLVSKSGSIDVENKFAMKWELTPQGKKHTKPIVEWVKKCDELILATDPDREGEAISWHIINYLKDKKLLAKKPVKRVTFTSITKDSVLKAFENPRDLNDNLVNAYLGRTALDYLVGYGISPVLWRKLPGARSAGRVQSVALKLITEREKEIKSFVNQEYWQVVGAFETAKKEEILSDLTIFNGNKLQKLDIENEKQCNDILSKIKKQSFKVKDIVKKVSSRKPYPPYITSTLQQDAARKLSFSTRQTMQVAQKLYEGISLGKETVGLITYMRTDGTDLEGSFLHSLRDYIGKKYTKEYLTDKPVLYKRKTKNAQEAHEAIRPTSMENSPEKVKNYLTSEQLKLYTLIWNRTLACQMSAIKYNLVGLHIANDDSKIEFYKSGSTIAFKGFSILYGQDNLVENILPELEIGQELKSVDFEGTKHFTQAPPRYNEASLIKKLEELGIGRPSTYAPIIAVLQAREYVKLTNKQLVPEDRGILLSEFLMAFFTKYVEYTFTSDMEDRLDSVSNGQASQIEMLKDFWTEFNENVETAKELSPLAVADRLTECLSDLLIGEDRNCPTCKDGNLVIKTSKFGGFIGCSNYPDCNYVSSFNTNSDEQGEDSLSINDSLDDNIKVKKGPYGYYIEGMHEGKMKKVSIPDGIEVGSLDASKVYFLLKLPYHVTDYEGKDVSLSIGRFGPYLKHGSDFVSYKQDIFTVNKESAIEAIEQNRIKKEGIKLGKYKRKDVAIKFGRFGAYIPFDGVNIRVVKEYDPFKITLEEAIALIDKKIKKT